MALTGGDVNGDGRADLVVGAPKADDGTMTDLGQVHVFYGSASFDAISDVTFAGVGGDELGWSVAVTDVNGDGFFDVTGGAPGRDVGATTNVGAVLAWFGASVVDTVLDWTVQGTSVMGELGRAVR